MYIAEHVVVRWPRHHFRKPYVFCVDVLLQFVAKTFVVLDQHLFLVVLDGHKVGVGHGWTRI